MHMCWLEAPCPRLYHVLVFRRHSWKACPISSLAASGHGDALVTCSRGLVDMLSELRVLIWEL